MLRYSGQTRVLVAVDCIIFGFDGENLKVLLIKRGFEPEVKKWSLMGGFILPEENLDQSANRILKQLTGLEGVFMEQLQAFGDPKRDPLERTVCVAYYALIDLHQYEKQISKEYDAEWFMYKSMPKLIFDHEEMVRHAKNKLKYKAALHPILFELLPGKFTIPQLQSLYEVIYNVEMDKRNFSRKVLATGLLIKKKEKDRLNSKKGAYFYILDKEKYEQNFQAFLNLVPRLKSMDL